MLFNPQGGARARAATAQRNLRGLTALLRLRKTPPPFLDALSQAAREFRFNTPQSKSLLKPANPSVDALRHGLGLSSSPSTMIRFSGTVRRWRRGARFEGRKARFDFFQLHGLGRMIQHAVCSSYFGGRRCVRVDLRSRVLHQYAPKSWFISM
jgi:hypothetical protein